MPTKITDLATISALDSADALEVVDVSDNTDDPAGSSFKVLISQILALAPVQSVFGRTGAVVAAASDYDANQIDNTPTGNLVATDVQAAVDELEGEKVGSYTQGAEVKVNNTIGLTQTEYDAIGTPDANTLYLITGP